MLPFVYFGLIVLAFFFLIVLPQRRRAAAHQAMVAALERGDEIITTGGIHGTIRALDDRVIELEIADGVVIRLARPAVSQRVAAGAEPEVDGESADEATPGPNG